MTKPGRQNPRSAMLGSPLSGDFASPSADMPKELRLLGSAFPGLQYDPDIISLFTDKNTGLVEAWNVEGPDDRVEKYYLGGDEDYRIDVIRNTELPAKKIGATVARKYYVRKGIIRTA